MRSQTQKEDSRDELLFRAGWKRVKEKPDGDLLVELERGSGMGSMEFGSMVFCSMALGSMAFGFYGIGSYGIGFYEIGFYGFALFL